MIPRVHTSTAPALIVIAGSTGAGKSTLLNTLANAKVSATGVRRPTTGTPVLACHPDDHEWFAEGGLLGSLERRQAPGAKPGLDGLVLVSTERLPQGVALLDTPDIDSVVEEHHEIAHRMLDAADLWIFVTTAARYADAPAWRLLRLAKERGARLAIVLSRVPPSRARWSPSTSSGCSPSTASARSSGSSSTRARSSTACSPTTRSPSCGSGWPSSRWTISAGRRPCGRR
nr:hypothetical protein GCM10020093_048710 [Planobispora longispora]